MDKSLYYIWRGMVSRCKYPKDPAYTYYGGRGIKVCERWSSKGGYSNFLSDMGQRPLNYVIDRIDPNGDYEPSNCRWVSCGVSTFNRNKSVRNKSGYAGVRQNRYGTWDAKIGLNHKVYTLGTYQTIEEAAKVRRDAELKYYGKTLQDE